MHRKNTYKALLITLLLSSSVLFALFSIHITKKAAFIAESVYEIEPKTEEEILQDLEEENAKNKTSTNKAFNEDEAFKNVMKNFKTVSPNDFENTTNANEANKAEFEQELSANVSQQNTGNFTVKQSEKETYNTLKALLDKKANAQNVVAEHAKGGSTLTYSLKNRALVTYKTPRYLCERSGKIIVNIKVNESGNVFDAYINGASNSKDQCLQEHALEYAKSVRFNTAMRSEQLGSITFYFKGKK